MTSVDDILKQGRELLLSFGKKPASQPVGNDDWKNDNWRVCQELNEHWQTKLLQVLTPVGYKFEDTIHEFYLDKLSPNSPLWRMSGYDTDVTRIIHGHSRDKGCATPTQCHVLGYQPTGNEPKPFLENWKRFGYES